MSVSKVVIFALVCECAAFGQHRRKSDHDLSSNERYDAMLRELNSADAGADLVGGLILQSVQSVSGSGAPNSSAPVKGPQKKEEVVLKVAAKAAKEEKTTPLRTHALDKGAEVPKSSVAKTTANVAQKVEQLRADLKSLKKATVATKSSKKAAAPIEGKSGRTLSGAVQAKPSSKLHVPEKVGHSSAVPQHQENKKKVREDTLKSIPMASFALEAKNSTEHVDGSKAVHNQTEKSFVKASKPSNSANDRFTSTHYSVGTVGHINVSADQGHHAPNATQTKENTTKAIEQAVVSLPMASFALEEPAPAKNKTEPKFPGNATEKAAFEKKEKALEKEVETLKARLENATSVLESNKKQTLPQGATDTFISHIDQGSKKIMAEKTAGAAKQVGQNKPAASMSTMMSGAADKMHIKSQGPTTVMAEKETPKAPMPTMMSGSAPVESPKDARKVQGESAKKVASTSAVAHTHAKKQTALVIESTVGHNADDAPADPIPMFTPRWFSSLFSWMSGGPWAPAVKEEVAAPRAVVSPKKKALVWMKQDSERTAQATMEEHQHNFDVQDAWSQLEADDIAKEEHVRSDDVAERLQAAEVEPPRHLQKSEMKGRHGVHMSGFWDKLEKQDDVIAESVHSDDLVKYAELTHAQDNVVAQESQELAGKPTLRGHASNTDDVRLAIHEPWLRREQRDQAIEQKVHASPDLQMLQLEHSRQRKEKKAKMFLQLAHTDDDDEGNDANEGTAAESETQDVDDTDAQETDADEQETDPNGEESLVQVSHKGNGADDDEESEQADDESQASSDDDDEDTGSNEESVSEDESFLQASQNSQDDGDADQSDADVEETDMLSDPDYAEVDDAAEVDAAEDAAADEDDGAEEGSNE